MPGKPYTEWLQASSVWYMMRIIIVAMAQAK